MTSSSSYDLAIKHLNDVTDERDAAREQVKRLTRRVSVHIMIDAKGRDAAWWGVAHFDWQSRGTDVEVRIQNRDGERDDRLTFYIKREDLAAVGAAVHAAG